MFRIVTWTATLLALFVLLSVSACGSSITFEIASDLTGEWNSRTGNNVAITPHAAWAVPPAGAAWVSFADTGMGTGSFFPQNSAGLADITATFFESFWLAYENNRGTVTVWADDTARVLLNGVVLLDYHPALDVACASGPIGCQPGEAAGIHLDGALRQGVNILAFETYQLGGGPFGIAYSGTVMSHAPEPGSWVLLCSGLALVVGVRAIRRRL